MPPQHTPPLLLVQAPEVLLQGEQAAVTVSLGVGPQAIQNAVLAARAVHIDSQQQLGMVPVASGATSPTQAQRQPDGGCRLLLGDLAAGQQQQALLLLDARYTGAVEVTAELQVRLLSMDGGGHWCVHVLHAAVFSLISTLWHPADA